MTVQTPKCSKKQLCDRTPKNANLGARRVATQGRPLSPEFTRAIVLVKDYFDRTTGDLREQEGSRAERTAHALGVGLATVKRVMADSKRSPAGLLQEASIRRGRPPRVLSEALQTITREYVRQANREGSHITLEMLAEYLQAEGGDPHCSVRTLGRALDRKLVFKRTRKTGDYHGQMHHELLSKWLSEQLLPNIPKHSLIMM